VDAYTIFGAQGVPNNSGPAAALGRVFCSGSYENVKPWAVARSRTENPRGGASVLALMFEDKSLEIAAKRLDTKGLWIKESLLR
jgi:hypothetical protein